MKKILVVEDEYYARKSIVKILQESDLDIQVCGEAENGMKAIELLEEYKDIALVITDIQMQKMGGLELASYLHKHIPEIDVLILTAFENFDYAREALRYNVKDYIVKPIYKENLLPPVKKVLEKQEEKSRNQEKIKNYYQWEAAKNYFPVKTIVAHEELYLKEMVIVICSGKENTKKKSKIVEEIVHYVENNYYKNISLRELAENKYFVNYSYCSRLFSQETGMNFSKYLIQYRLKKAKTLLENKDMKISFIAFEVGYNDVSHFIQSFKKSYGLTPEEYRARKKIE